MKQLNFIFALILLTISGIQAQAGYKIDVQLDNFTESQLFLANYYGEKAYIKDTVLVKQGEKISFQGEEELDPGVYLIVLPPDNQQIQLLINKGNQHFSVKADAKKLAGSVVIKGSAENERFYQYLNYLGDQNKKAGPIRKKMEGLTDKDDKQKEKLKEKLQKIDAEVKAEQQNIIKKYPRSLMGNLILMSIPLQLPEFEGEDKFVQSRQWYKTHYFDNINLRDDRLLRSPMLHKKVDDYVKFCTVLTPDSLNLSADSINVAIDRVMNLAKPDGDIYRYYLSHFLNKYAKEKIVGMDAVYVYLVQNYYARGKASWISDEQLEKIRTDAAWLQNSLIGMQAPPLIGLEKIDSTFINLYDIDAEYLVMVLWRPGCGTCKKSMPKVVEFYKAYNQHGIKVLSISTDLREKAYEAWKFIEEKEMQDFINTIDPYNKTKFIQKYNGKTTPKIYILNKNKKIIMKGIGAEQLPEVMDRILRLHGKVK